MKKIIHIAPVEKFILPFIKIVNDKKNNFPGEHEFILIDDGSFDLKNYVFDNINIISNNNKKKKFFYILKALLCGDKIIIHGLFDSMLMLALSCNYFNRKKHFWVIWGRELYSEFYNESRTKKIVKYFAINSINNIITYIKGDFELLKYRYKVNPAYWNCLAYDSNTVDLNNNLKTINKDEVIRIMVGNSADSTNNHKEAFELINKIFHGQSIEVYCPLSYAVNLQTEDVVAHGFNLFGNKFNPLRNFIPLDEYKNILKSIDIAVFMHKRQQGMGNMINLVGQGKKVYMRSDVSSWDFFAGMGIKVYDVFEMNNSKIEKTVATNNIDIVKNNFNKNVLVEQWKNIFERV